MSKLLFLPSDHGGGLGHVSRCLHLAMKSKKHGHDAAIVLEKKHFEMGLKSELKTFLFDTRMERLYKYQFKKPHKPIISLQTKISTPPLFLEFNSLAYQVPRDGYVSEKIVRKRIKHLDKIIYEYSPDVLIGDTNFLSLIIGKKHDIPVIQITRFAGFPPEPNMIWWQEIPPDIVPPDALAPFAGVISQYLGVDQKRAEDLLRGDRYLIPSTHEIEPILCEDEEVIYTGPLIDHDVEYREVEFFRANQKDPKIYLSIGGGAIRSQENKFFEKLINVFNKTEYKVLISTGRRTNSSKFNGRSDNLFFIDWVHGLSAIRAADIVIYHGGYNTTIETLYEKKPSIVIPSHTEQEGNGRRLEALGIGKIVKLHKQNMQPLKFVWPYGIYTILAGFEMDLDKDEIITKIRDLSDVNIRIKKISDDMKKKYEETNFEDIYKF
jgi:UDP:flavonoid glycosyltransferase YjiC (YdhE family)